MTDPSTLLVGSILKLAFDEFIKSSVGETAKTLTGKALGRANELRQTLLSYFVSKKNQKAVEAINTIEETGSENALGKLEVHLEIAMETDKPFSKKVRLLVEEIESLRTVKQVIGQDLEIEGSLEAEGLKQVTDSGTADVEQIMFKNVQVKKDVRLTNLIQETLSVHDVF